MSTEPPKDLAFRETFLEHFEPADRNCLLALGEILGSRNELPGYGPESDESITVRQVRAAVADLRYLAGVFDHLSTEPSRTTLDREDRQICEAAGSLATRIEELLSETEGLCDVALS